MPVLGYRNRYIPGEDLNQGKIITPPDKQFPVADYRAQMAFTQALGKVGEVLLNVEENRKYAVTQSLKIRANTDLASDEVDYRQLPDVDEIDTLSTTKRQERLDSYKEMAEKAGLNFDTDVLPQIDPILRKHEINVKAIKAEKIHKDNENMMFSMVGMRKEAMVKAPLDERGNLEYENQKQGLFSLYDDMVAQKYISQEAANQMKGQTEQIKQQRYEGFIKSLWNAGQAEDAVRVLSDKSMLQGLNPIKREELTHSSLVMARVTQGQRDQEAKAKLKEAHDTEERNIGMMVLNGQYRQAFQAVRGSKFLTGDELAKWGSTIETQSTKERTVDPIAAAKEIVTINRMIATEENPDSIRRYIIQSPNLRKEDKEQYLNKLETKYNAEIEEGRKQGYHEIENLITPKRGMMSTLLKTSSETVATSKAQMMLDEWIAGQVKAGKQITSMDVRKKAISLGEQNQVSMSTKLMEIEEEGKRVQREAEVAEEMRKAAAKRAEEEKKAISKGIRGKIQ